MIGFSIVCSIFPDLAGFCVSKKIKSYKDTILKISGQTNLKNLFIFAALKELTFDKVLILWYLIFLNSDFRRKY